jgi:hypothetical protein
MSEKDNRSGSKSSKSQPNPFADFVIDPLLLTPAPETLAQSITANNPLAPRRYKGKKTGDEAAQNPPEAHIKTAPDDNMPHPKKKSRVKNIPKERAKSELPSLLNPWPDVPLN